MRRMVTGDREDMPADRPARPGFELRGNKLVCKCHGRVVLVFDAAALERHHEQQRTAEARRGQR